MHRILAVVTVLLLSFTSYADESIIARVNGSAITARDLETAVNRLIPQTTYHGSVPEEKRREFREKALDNLIVQELQYQDALARGIKPPKKRVKERMKQIRSRFKSRSAYKAALKEAGITHSELKKRVEREVRIETVIERTVKGPAHMTDEELKEYYDANVTKFKQPESVRLRVISTKDRKKANDLLKRIKAGEDFGSIAAQYSEDDYRIRGGDIGYIHRGRIQPEIEKVAFALKPGRTSDLLKVKDTWFIIKAEEKQPERQLDFDKARDKMKKRLETKRANELMEKWLEDLRAKAKIEILSKR